MLRKFVRTIRNIFAIPGELKKIPKIVKGETFYPELERKTVAKRYMDNIIWVLKYKEANKFYNSYGLDIKNFRKLDDYIAYNQFQKERDQRYIENRYSRIFVLRDKYTFSIYFKELLGDIVPKTLGYMSNSKMLLPEKYRGTNFGNFLDDMKDGELVVKKNNGE